MVLLTNYLHIKINETALQACNSAIMIILWPTTFLHQHTTTHTHRPVVTKKQVQNTVIICDGLGLTASHRTYMTMWCVCILHMTRMPQLLFSWFSKWISKFILMQSTLLEKTLANVGLHKDLARMHWTPCTPYCYATVLMTFQIMWTSDCYALYVSCKANIMFVFCCYY